MVVLHSGQVFVFEFKLTDGEDDIASAAQSAIEQAQDKGYAEKYRGRGGPVHLVAAVFSREARNLAAVKVVPA